MIYKLKYIGDKVVIASLPLSSWTIVNTNTLSVSGNTVTQLGVGGWYESMYKSFTVPTSGSYTISYDYDIASGVVGGHGTYGFGLWLTTNNPNVSGDPQYQFYANSANRNGSIIAGASTNMAGMKGNITFTASLTANTTYYLWYPGAALDDGTTYTLTFRNIAVYNNPVQYTFDKDIKFQGTRVTYDYTVPIPASVMWFNDTGSYTNSATVNFSTKPTSSADYNYFAIRFNAKPGALGDVVLYTASRRFCIFRGHPYISYSGLVAVGNGDAWTACSPITSMTTGSLDGWTMYQTSLWPKSTNKWIKIVFDRPNNTAYLYVESTLVCTATMQVDPINIVSLTTHDDQGRGRNNVNNISIAAFTSLDAAKNYNGPF